MFKTLVRWLKLWAAVTNILWRKQQLRECIQKFPYWPPGAKTANGTALCPYVQLYRYFV